MSADWHSFQGKNKEWGRSVFTSSPRYKTAVPVVVYIPQRELLLYSGSVSMGMVTEAYVE